ncbi:MAG: DUF5060 domain-containing protein [Candidatus Sumerlaeia bacterium]|nr:DUF5060 domain-containing protein [Candidatus Sumerlaeia bacterium]
MTFIAGLLLPWLAMAGTFTSEGMDGMVGNEDAKDRSRSQDWVVLRHAFRIREEIENPFMAPVWVVISWRGRNGSGANIHVPAFYDGDSTWKVRYTPLHAGEYTVDGYLLGEEPRAAITLSVDTQGDAGLGFYVESEPVGIFPTPCTEHVQRFRFNSGEPYFPMGYNLGWTTLDGYKTHFAKMEKAGLNWSRAWMCHWSDQNPGWVMGRDMSQGELDLDVLRKWDAIIGEAEKRGILLQLVLQHHGQYSTWVNPNWEENPWNVENGGWLGSPSDFFTDEKARMFTRARYRYFVARWGYSPAILAWELFNEVEFTDGYLGESLVSLWPQAGGGLKMDAATVAQITSNLGGIHEELASAGPGSLVRLMEAWRNMSLRRPVLYDFGLGRDVVADWHGEMAAYIRRHDPTPRMITTSSVPPDSRIWDSMDFLQVHTYQREMITPMVNLPGGVPHYEKPVFVGEMGDHEIQNSGKGDGRYHHGMIWGGLFSGAAGAAQVWAWDRVVDLDLYPLLRSLVDYSNLAEHSNHPYRPVSLAAYKMTSGSDHAPLAAHGLVGHGRLLLWVYDPASVNLPNPPMQNAYIHLPDFLLHGDDLRVTWWNTREGIIKEVSTHNTGNGEPLSTPEFSGDIAAIIVSDVQNKSRSLP